MDGGEFATNPRNPQSTKILCICTGTSCNITVWGTDYLMTQFQLLRLSGITCIYISEWIMKSLFEWREREAPGASTESRHRTHFTPCFKITSVENPNGIRDFTKSFEPRQTRNTGLSKFKTLVGRLWSKQSLYRSGQALRIPGDWGSQISRQSAHECGNVVSPT